MANRDADSVLLDLLVAALPIGYFLNQTRKKLPEGRFPEPLGELFARFSDAVFEAVRTFPEETLGDALLASATKNISAEERTALLALLHDIKQRAAALRRDNNTPTVTATDLFGDDQAPE